MDRKLAVLTGLVLALVWTNLAAQKKACSLLTAAEINASVPGKVGEPHETNMGASGGAAKGMGNCMWKVGDMGMVSVGIMPAAQGAEREEGLKKIKASYDALRAKGWKEEKKEFGYGSCSVMTPPASEKDAPIMSGCLAEAKGSALGVTYLDPKQKLEPDKAKVLLDKVIGHL